MYYSIWLCSKRIIFFSTSQNNFPFLKSSIWKKGNNIFFVSLCTTLPSYTNSIEDVRWKLVLFSYVHLLIFLSPVALKWFAYFPYKANIAIMAFIWPFISTYMKTYWIYTFGTCVSHKIVKLLKIWKKKNLFIIPLDSLEFNELVLQVFHSFWAVWAHFILMFRTDELFAYATFSSVCYW